MKFLFFVVGATLFAWLDMTVTAYVWIFLAGTIYESQRIRSCPHLITADA